MSENELDRRLRPCWLPCLSRGVKVFCRSRGVKVLLRDLGETGIPLCARSCCESLNTLCWDSLRESRRELMSSSYEALRGALVEGAPFAHLAIGIGLQP